MKSQKGKTTMTEIDHSQDSEPKSVLTYLSSSKKPLVIFGAGMDTQEIIKRFFPVFHIQANAIWETVIGRVGSNCLGYPVIGLEELVEKYPHADILVPTTLYSTNLVAQLTNVGLIGNVIRMDNRSKADMAKMAQFFQTNVILVKRVYSLLADEKSKKVFMNRINFLVTREIQYIEDMYEPDQYFDADIVKLKNDEIFVDAGAFDGDTALDFAERTNYNYAKMVLLEPDGNNFTRLIQRTLSLKNIECLNKGTWDTKDSLSFNSGERSGSSITSNGQSRIEVDSIDNILHGDPCTYIKLDVEGAETKSLFGAAKTIRTFKPRLAVCVYHRIEDIFLLPLQIKDIYPHYQIYFRHHSPTEYETVCYAINEK